MTLPKLPCYLTTTKGRTNLTRLIWRPECGCAVVVEDSKELVTEMPIKDWHLFLSHWNSNATDFFFFRLVIDDTNTIWMERIEKIVIYWFWFCSPRVNPDILAHLKSGLCAWTPLDGKERAAMAPHLILPQTDMKPANYTHTLWYSNLKAPQRPACSLDIDLAL